jgi:MYXO-CTERM domain-containing protein
VSIHDNVFVDSSSAAITLQDHDLPLKLAQVYNNTLYTTGTGISCGSADEGSAVVGNLIFAGNPIAGTIGDERDNLVGALAEATSRVTMPSFVLAEMDFYPLPGGAGGSAIDLTAFAGDSDYDRDFNGVSKGAFTFRGAYAGEGANPGWHLGADIKGEVAANPGSDGGTSGADGGGAANSDAGAGGSGTDGGCGCRTARSSSRPALALLMAVLIVVRRRRSGV